MKLFYSATSPFVRKCLVTAEELELRARVELLPAAPHPVNRDRALVACNPLGKAPTLITDDGAVLYDSRVICEYFDAIGNGQLMPERGASRWSVLTTQALADGLMDAAVLTRYEIAARPDSLRWSDWVVGQLEKVTCALDDLEQRIAVWSAGVDAGSIAVACALGYLDFRYATLAWRQRCPKTAQWFDTFAKRDSMVATQPPAA
jgi:glutathione S-transferase